MDSASQPIEIKKGTVIFRLTAVAVGKPTKEGEVWKCHCECGGAKEVPTKLLRRALRGNGGVKSCGCLHRENGRATGQKVVTHGHARHGQVAIEYRLWTGMKARCNNPKYKSYKYYGARGIKVCERWESSFEDFLADMGPRPSPKHSIERKKNNEGYSPDNCCWATKVEQSRNTRRNVFLTYNGETKTITDWAFQFGLDAQVIRVRLRRGLTVEQALTWERYKPIPGQVGVVHKKPKCIHFAVDDGRPVCGDASCRNTLEGVLVSNDPGQVTCKKCFHRLPVTVSL